jgi:hypothetical protein
LRRTATERALRVQQIPDQSDAADLLPVKRETSWKGVSLPQKQ